MFADDWADLVEDVRAPDRAVWFASSFSRASLNASPTSRATSFKPSVFRPRSSAAAARRCPAFEVASFNCSPALPAASRNCSPVVPRVRFSISLTGNAAATTAPAATMFTTLPTSRSRRCYRPRLFRFWFGSRLAVLAPSRGSSAGMGALFMRPTSSATTRRIRTSRVGISRSRGQEEVISFAEAYSLRVS